MPLAAARFVPDPTQWRNSGASYQVLLAWITPSDFERLAHEALGMRGFDIANFKLNTAMAYPTSKESKLGESPGLYRSMYEGIPITPPYLDLENAVMLNILEAPNGYLHRITGATPNVKVRGAEGRNRARIAWELGIPLIPTRFYIHGLKNWFSGYEIFEPIWERPDIEAQILRNLGIREFRLDKVG